MGTALALLSAVCYGIADFTGGLLSRRTNPAVVAAVGQLGALVLLALAALAVPAARVGGPDLAWGALSGVGTGVGMLFLYRGLRHGAMSVVVPVSAVTGLAIPVLVGLALLGDRPTLAAASGMAVAAPALWLVSRDGSALGSASAASTLYALVAGVGIAVQYLALARAGAESGIWPVVLGRLTATLAILPAVGGWWRSADRCEAERSGVWRTGAAATGAWRTLGAAATGGCAGAALVAYLLATRMQLVTVAVVLSSLYPVLPVVLGLAVLRERLRVGQLLGLLTSGVAVVLLTLG